MPCPLDRRIVKASKGHCSDPRTLSNPLTGGMGPRSEDGPPSRNPGPSDTVAGSRSQLAQPAAIPGMPDVNFDKYKWPNSTSSKDGTTKITVHASFEPTDLRELLSEHVALPPMPAIHIKGVHKVLGSDMMDFDLKLNMMRYVLSNPDK